MKKVVFYGFAASVLAASPAFAVDGASLTTKNYVDTGLRAVYSAAKTTTDGLDERTTALEAVINGDNGDNGLAAAVEQLQQDIQSVDGVAYNAGMGIEINNHEISVKGLSGTEEDGKMYVYKNGALEALSVAATWDTEFDFAPSQNNGGGQNGGSETPGQGD